jgi:hypothetical protein
MLILVLCTIPIYISHSPGSSLRRATQKPRMSSRVGSVLAALTKVPGSTAAFVAANRAWAGEADTILGRIAKLRTSKSRHYDLKPATRETKIIFPGIDCGLSSRVLAQDKLDKEIAAMNTVDDDDDWLNSLEFLQAAEATSVSTTCSLVTTNPMPRQEKTKGDISEDETTEDPDDVPAAKKKKTKKTKTKTPKAAPEPKPILRIFIDSHEHSLIALLGDLGLDFVTCCMFNPGDIVITVDGVPLLLIERKTDADLVASIKDGRQRSQKVRMLSLGIPVHRIVYLRETRGISDEPIDLTPEVVSEIAMRLAREYDLLACLPVAFVAQATSYQTELVRILLDTHLVLEPLLPQKADFVADKSHPAQPKSPVVTLSQIQQPLLSYVNTVLVDLQRKNKVERALQNKAHFSAQKGGRGGGGWGSRGSSGRSWATRQPNHLFASNAQCKSEIRDGFTWRTTPSVVASAAVILRWVLLFLESGDFMSQYDTATPVSSSSSTSYATQLANTFVPGGRNQLIRQVASASSDKAVRALVVGGGGVGAPKNLITQKMFVAICVADVTGVSPAMAIAIQAEYPTLMDLTAIDDGGEHLAQTRAAASTLVVPSLPSYAQKNGEDPEEEEEETPAVQGRRLGPVTARRIMHLAGFADENITVGPTKAPRAKKLKVRQKKKPKKIKKRRVHAEDEEEDDTDEDPFQYLREAPLDDLEEWEAEFAPLQAVAEPETETLPLKNSKKREAKMSSKKQPSKRVKSCSKDEKRAKLTKATADDEGSETE